MNTLYINSQWLGEFAVMLALLALLLLLLLATRINGSATSLCLMSYKPHVCLMVGW